MYLIETFENDNGKYNNVAACARLFFTMSDADNVYELFKFYEVKNIHCEKINFFHAIVKYPRAIGICFSNFLFNIIHHEKDF